MDHGVPRGPSKNTYNDYYTQLLNLYSQATPPPKLPVRNFEQDAIDSSSQSGYSSENFSFSSVSDSQPMMDEPRPSILAEQQLSLKQQELLQTFGSFEDSSQELYNSLLMLPPKRYTQRVLSTPVNYRVIEPFQEEKPRARTQTREEPKEEVLSENVQWKEWAVSLKPKSTYFSTNTGGFIKGRVAISERQQIHVESEGSAKVCSQNQQFVIRPNQEYSIVNHSEKRTARVELVLLKGSGKEL